MPTGPERFSAEKPEDRFVRRGGSWVPRTRWRADQSLNREDPVPFSSELDAFLAKVQVRLDAAMGEAREELKEMAVEAEKEWSELRQRFGENCCESAKPSGAETASQSETSTTEVGDQQPG